MDPTLWLALGGFIVLCLIIDLKFVVRGDRVPSMRSSAIWSVLWTGLGLAFIPVVAKVVSTEESQRYLTGFLIEKSLSLDNLFVFTVLLVYFSVPLALQRTVLIWGIAGAVVLRGIFILVGAAALDAFHFTIYVFGGFLIYTAYKMATHQASDVDPEKTLGMRLLHKLMPVTGRFEGKRFFVQEKGKRAATPLFAALVMVAFFDVLFAVDSVPAIFAVSRDPFVVFAANAFSLLGMTSLYFLLAGALDRFRYLNLGLAAVLAWVGVKMLLSEVWHAPNFLSLGIILGILAVAVIASWLRPLPPSETPHPLDIQAAPAPARESDPAS